MSAYPSGVPDDAVSAVVVTWNSEPVVAQMLRSLATQPNVVDITVIDNASSDDTVATVTRTAPHAALIRNDRNLGLAAAINQGLVATASPFVLLCNADISLAPDAVAAMLRTAERHPDAAFVIPCFERADGRRRTSVGDLPTLRSALLGRQAARRSAHDAADHGFWWDQWDHATERQVPRGSEACYLARRSVIARIGPQDERFRLDWEGIDWAARANEAGAEIWFCPEARVMHIGGQSIRQVQARWIVSSHKGMYRYFAKRSSPSARPFLAVVFAVRAAAKLAVLGVGSRIYDAADDAF